MVSATENLRNRRNRLHNPVNDIIGVHIYMSLENKSAKLNNWGSILRKAVVTCFWLSLIVVCFIYRDEITVERIVNFTPENPVLAAFIMLCLFALKSVTFFIYGGILYAANGILFSLPVAVLMNIAGTIVMTSIPFFIGKRAGSKALEQLTHKSPKLEMLKDVPNKNEFFVSFFVRIVGLLPGDLVGMYLGASGIRFSQYFLGTQLGLLPAVISFSVMGMSIDDPSSPAFIISACFEVGLMLLSVLLFFVWRRRQKKKTNA